MSSNLEGDLNQDGIIDEMDRLRGDLGGEINQLGDRVRTLFDWQAYVRSAPLTSVGVAFVAGYLLAPAIFSKRAGVSAYDQPIAPGRFTGSGPSASSSGGIMGALWGAVSAGLTRAGSAYITDLLMREFTGPSSSSAEEKPSPEHAQPPFDIGD